MCQFRLVLKAAFFLALIQSSYSYADRGYKRITAVEFAGSMAFDKAEEDRLRAQTDLQRGDNFNPERLSIVALQLKKFGVVKESTAILDETKGVVGIAFWLKPASVN